MILNSVSRQQLSTWFDILQNGHVVEFPGGLKAIQLDGVERSEVEGTYTCLCRALSALHHIELT